MQIFKRLRNRLNANPEWGIVPLAWAIFGVGFILWAKLLGYL